MPLKSQLEQSLRQGVTALYPSVVALPPLVVQPTSKEFSGTYTLITFPLASYVGRSAQAIGTELGEWLKAHTPLVSEYQVLDGFLNISFSDHAWRTALASSWAARHQPPKKTGKRIIMEIACPNTNKPLHLGHLRNTFIGDAVAHILQAVGHEVYRITHINDRGIHICKSMVAYQRFGQGATPAQVGMKGDHFVGKYYVKFDQVYKEEVAQLTQQLGDATKAEKQAPILLAAQRLLQEWEQGVPEVIALWKQMNQWVYEGFEETYRKLDVHFDTAYYESETYLSGKEVVEQGLKDGVFYKQEDGSIWVDLAAYKLGKKLLLRSDGTAVYITQDLGTADLRYRDFAFDQSIYVVGNEQDHHFAVLFAILHKLRRPYADQLHHLSYGMVDLPTGKMKSREGTVVDADHLIADMVALATQHTTEQEKLNHFAPDEAERLYHTLAMGALKYFLLKVNPQKRIVFDPQASIDFHGYTGPAIQYTYARIVTMLQKSDTPLPERLPDTTQPLQQTEQEVIRYLIAYPEYLDQAAAALHPSIVAGYLYDLAKAYNRLYAALPVLREPNETLRKQRLYLSHETAYVLKKASNLLGMTLPERM